MTQPWLSDGSDVTYRTREHRVSYAPADDGGIWTFRQQEESPTEIVSALPAGISEADALQQIAQHISLESRESQSIAGRYPVTPEGQAEANAMYPQVQADAQALREAPTDTAELRAFLLARAQNDDFLLPEPRSDDDAVKSQIGDIVGDPMAPHALRAAALRLLGELPGVVAEPYDPAPDSLGNPPFIAAGTAITVNEFRGNSFQLIFDTESARMLGTRVVLTEETEQYPGSEVGTVTLLQRIESTVVDQIPDVESW
ncbi:hypothetical protein [Leucobacter musarum]|uniref:hypothetical protein n=1 Tax=Leucobacter musarum TaxID=1930747 RepID=UPI0012E0F4DA|nr:hypothetical protein [Leucobacter musarum]